MIKCVTLLKILADWIEKKKYFFRFNLSKNKYFRWEQVYIFDICFTLFNRFYANEIEQSLKQDNYQWSNEPFPKIASVQYQENIVKYVEPVSYVEYLWEHFLKLVIDKSFHQKVFDLKRLLQFLKNEHDLNSKNNKP